MSILDKALLALTKKALEQRLKSVVNEANAKLQNLIDKDLYDYSNTIQRFHQTRLQEDFIGRVERSGGDNDNIVSAKFLTGTSHYTKNQLAFRLSAIENFLNDVNTSEERIRQQQENLARRMFNMEASEEVTQEQIENSKAIWRMWRKLGMSRDHFDESSGVLTEIVKQYELNGKDEAEGKLNFIRQMAGADFLAWTQDKLINTLSSGETDSTISNFLSTTGLPDIDDMDWSSFV